MSIEKLPTIYMLQGPPRRLEPIRREDCARLNDGVGVDGMPLVSVTDYDALRNSFASLSAMNEKLVERAEVGDAFMERLPKDYSWCQSPAEYVTDVENQLSDAKGMNEAMRAALEKYAVHLPDCPAWRMPGDRCSCGLAEAIKP